MRAKRRKASCLPGSSRLIYAQFPKCDPSPGLQIQFRVPEMVALLHPDPVAIQLQYNGNCGVSHIRHRLEKPSMSISDGIPGKTGLLRGEAPVDTEYRALAQAGIR